jgi:predicted amidophosphoribosyltransferase
VQGSIFGRFYGRKIQMDGHTLMHTPIMCPIHVHHQKIIQNGYNNVQEWYTKILTNLKYLLRMSGKKKAMDFKQHIICKNYNPSALR